MEIDIPMKRLQVQDILFAYNPDFLERHNLFDGNINFPAIAKTKYGYMAVKNEDYITYVGNGVWSVTENEQR